MTDVISKINWRVLRVQKQILLHLMDNKFFSENEKATVDGMVNMLDVFMDEAVYRKENAR